MNKLSILGIVLATFTTTQASAVSMAGIDGLTLLAPGDSVKGTGDFLNYSSSLETNVISPTQLHDDLTDSDYATYILSLNPTAYIDVAFNSTSLYNGVGNDLAFFFVGNIDSNENVVINFDLNINNTTHKYTPEITPTRTIVTDSFGAYTLTAALIDLDDFGLDYASQTALTNMRILLGTNNSANYPALSMIGGFHTSPVVIPLPLPIVLFASGLGVLGWFGRRNRA